VPLSIPVGDLTSSVSVSDDLDFAVEISQVLNMSLSEVQAQYFGGSDKSNKVDKRMQEERDTLLDDLQEQERFKENSRRRSEAEMLSYRENSMF
jgi:hypothetical protein